MTQSTVTFDFHNTLFVCDEWFELETQTIAANVIDRYMREHDLDPHETLRNLAIETYREIRAGIITSGNEKDAITCTLEVCNLLDIDIPSDLAEQFVEEMMYEVVSFAYPVEGVAETVRYLAAQGVQLGIVSSAAHTRFLHWCLEQYDLADSFDTVVTSASCGIYKSNPEIYRYTRNLLGANPQSLHIGDSHRFDVESASKAGWKTGWYTRGDHDVTSDLADIVLPVFQSSYKQILSTAQTKKITMAESGDRNAI